MSKITSSAEYPQMYSGKKQPERGNKANWHYKDNTNNIPLSPYVPEDSLVESVNLARTIHRPLLLIGEPGCGKTKLAYDVHYELNEEIFEYRVHSESTLNDAIYRYDGLLRLHDVEYHKHHNPKTDLIKKIASQINTLMKHVVDQKNPISGNKFQAYLEKANNTIDETLQKTESRRNPETAEDYIRYKPLGQGLKKNKPVIILIDEIENAPPEFQTDILRLLDEGRHEIIESDEENITFTQENLFIIVTSNKDKALSEAFLRRCIFHHIGFPKPDHLEKILKAHFLDTKQDQLESVINFFQEFRDKAEWTKKPSLSELIDWLKAATVNEKNIKSILANKEIHYPGTLIKAIKDIEMLKNDGYTIL